MAKSQNGGGGGRGSTVTNAAGNVFSFHATSGQILKDGASTNLGAIPAREVRYGNGSDKIHVQDANGGWKSYNGTAWVPDINPMGM